MPARLNSSLTTPNPDPTVLTTQALQREIEATRDRFNDNADLTRQVLEERIDCLEHEAQALRKELEAGPARREYAINKLKELVDEKFTAINARFAERDLRSNASQLSNKEAISAALTAVKETNSKSESAFTKQVDQLMALIYSAQKGADEKIDDVKERLTIMESRNIGAKEEATTLKQQGRDNTAIWAFGVAAIATAIAILNFIAIRLPANPL